MNKYLVSGVSPSSGGVGRLMSSLVVEAKNQGYQVITRRNNISINSLAIKKHWLTLIMEPFKRVLAEINFSFKTFFIKKSIILFIHPQLTGYPLLFKFLNARNKLFLYVMDNSFFCIQSYNYHQNSDTECFRCLGAKDSCAQDCKPFPNLKISKKKNLSYLLALQRERKKIFFLAQNQNQKKLLFQHFGYDSKVKVVGMNTGEFESFRSNTPDLSTKTYDVVFHGSTIYAKGIDYCVNLSLNLVDYSFFIPDSKSNVENYLGKKINSSNITFKACNWESGLSDIVKNARLVLVPSLWSAPIEGALIKSILFNGNVAVIKNMFGYSSEISDEAELLVLERDISKAAESVKKYLKSKRKKNKQKLWVNHFYKFNVITNLFNAINKEIG